MKPLRAALVLGLALLAPACRKSSDSHGNHVGGGPPPPTTSSEASVPPGSSPPIGLVWNVGFTENVTMAEMQDQFQKFLQLSQDLWTVTEGQVCLSQVRFFDAVAPGREASSSESLRVPNLDVVIYSTSKWDILPVAGQVIFFSPSGTLGRTDRRMDIPEDARRLTLLHEGSHFAWKLSWRGNDLPPGLDDEYNYDPADSACIMDLQFAPIRWCSGGSLPSPDHVTKSGGQEATSCWEQILKDYPAYHFGGSSNASSPLPALSVEYNDEP